MYSFILGITGLFFGSLAGLLIQRLPLGEPVFLSRSHCPSCKRVLQPLELLPIKSYLCLRGKCRTCHYRIPLSYIGHELGVGLLFFSLSFFTPYFPENIPHLLLAFLLYCHFFIDLKHFLLPDKLTIFIALTGLYLNFNMILEWTYWLPIISSGLAFYLLRAIGTFIYKKEAMGLGDVKLIMAIATFLSPEQLITMLYIAITSSGLIAFMLMFKKPKPDYLPFGPFLIISTGISYFVYDAIWTYFF